MPRTNLSSTTASTAASSNPDLPPPGELCAIHQPNFFPRLTTLAKLFAADYWIILDDVQFTRRDYQHRTRLAVLDDPYRRQWLTIPTHLPHGRRTAVREALIADPVRSRRRVAQMLPQYYGASPHWPALRGELAVVLDLFETNDKTAEVAEASTRLLLDLLGWRGQILRSSRLPARQGRSQRLADLTEATGARSYLCGTGGMKYLKTECFDAIGVGVIPFRTPASGIWVHGRENSALNALMRGGLERTGYELLAVAARYRAVTRWGGSGRASCSAGPAGRRSDRPGPR
ncbi:WbqC family protein [Streptomyces sp. NBC_01803]|uniref:WbqC family protein n=1 Tax=Streptomyces sp. NBC_01803 TaxID=2975946 RepID=UPI002DD8C8A8|nr:WbqC family protein [Streptomyces sp. NBC_01803]WSA46202.1 WbqC family protein [Streptomyces sp. NBC_01803]